MTITTIISSEVVLSPRSRRCVTKIIDNNYLNETFGFGQQAQSRVSRRFVAERNHFFQFLQTVSKMSAPATENEQNRHVNTRRYYYIQYGPTENISVLSSPFRTRRLKKFFFLSNKKHNPAFVNQTRIVQVNKSDVI